MTRKKTPKKKTADNGSPRPRYQLRVKRSATSEQQLEVWQLPSPATPALKEVRRIAGLHGRNLALVEHKVLRQLGLQGIDPTSVPVGEQRRFDLDEGPALRLGLLFRVLAPMRSRPNMQSCATGIEGMGKEEAAYWLGMAMHRKFPRRVLMALRILLIDPRGR